MLNPDQVTQLLGLVQSVSDSNNQEALETAASNAADAALAKATTDASDAKLRESNAQAATSQAIASLEHFVESLISPAPAAP